MAELVKFVKMSETSYNALVSKSDNFMYFVTDDNGNGNIYRGAKAFSESVVFVSTFPTSNISKGKIYIDDTGIGKVWTGTAWKDVMRPVMDEDLVDGKTQLGVVTADKLKTYVAAKLQDIAIESAGYSRIELDKATNTLKFYTTSGETETLAKSAVLDSYLTDVTFDKGILSFSVAGQEAKKTLDIKMMSLITNIEYDETTKEIVLTLNTDGSTTCRIPAEDIFSSYTTENTSSLELAIDSSTLKITGNVKISKSEGNALTVNADGLFVPQTADYKVTVGHAGEILTANADGTYDVSGYSMQTGVLGTNDKKIPNENVVKTYVDGKIINSISEAAAEDKALSEKLVLGLLSWEIVE